MKSFEDRVWWEQVLPSVSRPARYTDREWNAVHKDHGRARLRVVFAYPDTYELGMSHLGLRLLYHIVNDREEWLAERAFAPWTDLEEQLRRRGLPLCSLESGTPLRDFDVVGFTLPYELLYTNVLNMLDLAGIPLRSSERTGKHPLVIGGGPCAANPEPVAEFFDAFVLGEAEEAIAELCEAMVELGRGDRGALLARLAQIEGVYVPSLYLADYHPDWTVAGVTAQGSAPAIVRRRLIEDFNAAPYPTHQVVPYLEVVHDRIALEIMRGCTRGCRFCQAGMTYRPVRERTVETLLRQASESVACTGYDEISLLGFNSPDYSRAEELVARLTEEQSPHRVSISLPSLRIDTFSVGLAQRLQTVRKPGLTFAPEAGSQRLRDVINKQATEEDLFAAAQAAFRAGWNGFKLYFLLGLPTETEDDARAIPDLLMRLVRFGRAELGERQGRLRINVSLGIFVPKAHTPFQWVSQLSLDELDRRRRLVCDGVRSRQVQLSWQQPQQSLLEAAFARGDRRLSQVLLRAREVGCRFDAWQEEFRSELWEAAFRACDLDPGFYAHRERTADEVFPWDHLSYGVSRKFLRNEAERAATGQITPDCRGAECPGCGACGRAKQ